MPVSSLPDPSEPAIVALGGILGAFVGRAIARRRGHAPDQLALATAEGAYAGTAIGLAAYVLVNIIAALS